MRLVKLDERFCDSFYIVPLYARVNTYNGRCDVQLELLGLKLKDSFLNYNAALSFFLESREDPEMPCTAIGEEAVLNCVVSLLSPTQFFLQNIST